MLPVRRWLSTPEGEARSTSSFRKPVLYPPKSKEACRGFLYHFMAAKYSIKRWAALHSGLGQGVWGRGWGKKLKWSKVRPRAKLCMPTTTWYLTSLPDSRQWFWVTASIPRSYRRKYKTRDAIGIEERLIIFLPFFCD